MNELSNINKEGLSTVVIHPTQDYIYTFGGQEGLIRRFSSVSDDAPDKVLDDDPTQTSDNPFTCMSFSSTGDLFVIGGENGEVSLFEHPLGSFKSLICKFSTAAVSVSFDTKKYSLYMACAADNGEIRIFDIKHAIANQSQNAFCMQFMANAEGVRAIRFIDCASTTTNIKYLAVCSCDGHFAVWKLDISNGTHEEIANIKNAFPKMKASVIHQRMKFEITKNVNFSFRILYHLTYILKGKWIIIPGNNVLKLFSVDKMQFIENDSLSIGHGYCSLNCVKFSDDESLMVSSDIKSNVCFWKVSMDENKIAFEVVHEMKCETEVCNLMFDHTNKYLIMSGMNGSLFRYNIKIEDENKDEREENKENKEENEEKKENKEEKEKNSKRYDIFNDSEDEDIDLNKKIILKKKKKTIIPMNEKIEDNNKENEVNLDELGEENEDFDMCGDEDEDDIQSNDDIKDFIVEDNKSKKRAIENDENIDKLENIYPKNGDLFNIKKPNQQPFQNGSTKFDNNERYLNFNQIGAAIVRQSNYTQNIFSSSKTNPNIKQYNYEIEFWDKSKYTHAVRFTQTTYFDIAHVSNYGLVLASKLNTDNVSYIKYVPFTTGDHRKYQWLSSTKSQWTYDLPSDEYATCIAMSKAYIIIATNMNYIRILSVAGLQICPPICMAGDIINIATDFEHHNNIAITFMVNGSAHFCILDLDKNKKVYDGRLVISEDACLVRVFMVNEYVFTVDSRDIMRVCMEQMFGWSWIAILDLDLAIDKKYENPELDQSMIPKNIWPIFINIRNMSLMVLELMGNCECPIPSMFNSPQFVSYGLLLPMMNMNEVRNRMTDEMQISFGVHEEQILRQAMMYKLMNNGCDKSFSNAYKILFQFACASKKPMLAYDIALYKLHSKSSLVHCSRTAMKCNMSQLAEAINKLLKGITDDKSSVI